MNTLITSKLWLAVGILFLCFGIFLFIYFAQTILIPLVFAGIFAIILTPLVHFFRKKLKCSDFIATSITLLLTSGILLSLVLTFSHQIRNLFDDFPLIEKNLITNWNHLQLWFKQTFNISLETQQKWWDKGLKSGGLLNSDTVYSIFNYSGFLVNLVLVPIYTFLILIYRKNFTKFIFALNSPEHQQQVQLILSEISYIIRQYIIGLGIEMFFVAVLTGFGLWLIGLKYFIFLGILTAFLNLIPYLGILIACSISVLMTIVGTTDLTLISGVLGVNVVVQLIDNNILIPKIVGSKVSLNALASMLAVIIGGTLAGIGGMFLALPVLAILKVIFDHVEHLNHLSLLIGENKNTE